MRIEYKHVLKVGGCNFCDRGKLSENKAALVYPYDYVFQISSNGSGIIAKICMDCFKELSDFQEEIK